MPNQTPTATTTLTSNFWVLLGARFSAMGHDNIGVIIDDSANYLANYTEITYGDLPFWDTLNDKTQLEIVYMAYLVIGEPFARVFNALDANYNPLENYFTDRTYEESGDGSNTKTGKIKTKPEGKIKTYTNGDRKREYTNHGTTDQGTTYDNNQDFVNIAKHLTDGTVKDSFTNYGTTTEYPNGADQYSVTQEFTNVKDTAESSKEGEEHRSGNSGIFSKQDLTQREIDLRLRNKVAPILVRMVVDVFNTGVWRS